MLGEKLMQACVCAIGNFDGVHRGHLAVLEAARRVANGLKIPLCVLTFEPHPRQFFVPQGAPFRLTSFAQKVRYLKRAGAESVHALPFDKAFSMMEAEDFVSQVLHARFGCVHAVVGEDFVFGHNRGGDVHFLRAIGQGLGMDVTAVPLYGDRQNEVYSSTETRLALQKGDLAAARHILGRNWAIEGEIVKGRKLARNLGFPTANIDLKDYLRPKFGVYAAKAWQTGLQEQETGLQEQQHKKRFGICNIGKRPTIDGVTERLEIHLFDFATDIYGQCWEVELTRFIRPEITFSGVEALQAQIKADIEDLRAHEGFGVDE